MRPQSMTHKILAKASQHDYVKSGQIVEARIDLCFSHDPVLKELAELFYNEFGSNAKVWDPSRIALFQDHFVPAKDAESRQLSMVMDKFAKEQDIRHYYPYGSNYGVCHIVMCEERLISPGMVITGTDSHAVTYGALNTFATGVGMADLAVVFYTGELWFVVPEVIEVQVSGKFRDENVMAKDLILRIVGDLGMGGASGKAIEFTGNTIRNLSIDERCTLCNMVVEAGAKNGIMEFFESSSEYLNVNSREKFEPVFTDEDFEYYDRREYSAEDIEPMVAMPHRPDNVTPISKIKHKKISVDQVYIGSCTGGKYHDIKVACEILRGKKIANGVRLMIVPATMNVYKKLVVTDLIKDLLDAGAVIESPGCKACYGAHGGILGDGEICLSTTNRNFRGRMGNPNSEVFLCSPVTAAKSAIAGYITD